MKQILRQRFVPAIKKWFEQASNIFCSLLALFSPSSFATDLPPVTSIVYVVNASTGEGVRQVGSIPQTAAYSSGRASSSNNPNPTAWSKSSGNVYASSWVQYYFSVIGEQVEVPIIVHGQLTAKITNYTCTPEHCDSAGASSELQIGDYSRPYSNQSVLLHEWAGVGAYPNTIYSADGSFQRQLMVQAGDTIFVSISTQSNPNGDDSRTATALADPYIEIDKAYLLIHPTLTLQFSTGAANISPVPEPKLYEMLAIGLFVLGAIQRRARNGYSMTTI